MRTLFKSLHMDHMYIIAYVAGSDTCVQEMDEVLFEHYEVRWSADIHREGARRGNGRNNLRTYRLFKQEYRSEAYVNTTMSRANRSALAKFRCGVAPIRLETGRYEGLPEAERLCPVCDTAEVETEEHVLIRCPLYQDYRDELFQHAMSLCEYSV